MRRKTKKAYVSPTTHCVELKTEKILCGSSNPLSVPLFLGDDYSTPFDGGGEDW